MKAAIEIKHLSKKYNIGHEQQASAGTGTFRDALTNISKKPLELLTGHQMQKEAFWALDDISFNIQPGEVAGIIGRNGSGKSTLLKVLSRIVEPTKGEAILRGRVASLLEVGTGFHPELTGRENVYFNGAILGMKRREIQSKFDEIVAFSEVEKFLDTPVKFYSSGMYVRLAFAVAAHLDPDILIVDEVLAVGDASFQKKSLGKMKQVAKSGRTVVFVSHSMGSIKQMCNTAVLLKNGKVIDQGGVDKVIASYMSSNVNTGDAIENRIEIPGHEMVFENIEVNKTRIEDQPVLSSGDTITVTGSYSTTEAPQDLCIGFGLRSQSEGTLVFFTHNHLEDIKYETSQKGTFKCKLNVPPIAPANYSLEISIWLNSKQVILESELCSLTLLPAPAFKSKVIMQNFPSLLLVDSDWEFKSK